MAKLLDLGPANRQFYSLPCKEVCHDGVADLNEHHPKKIKNESNLTPENATTHDHKDSILQYIAENIIGADKTFSGPFGLRKVTYLDFVASGRALHCIEDYIRAEVLPEYGNTHTTTSVTSLQTTLFRHEARDILRNSFNASEHDSVIFTGSGSTGAVHKLIHALDLQGNPLIVLVGPYEHHSNILPWKEAGAEVVRIRQTEKGSIDMEHLELTLKTYQGGSRQLIGAFSAASNVTGVLTDVDAVTICLHKHGALAVWDYACAAPYVKLDMNPYVGGPDQPYVYKDAVVLSIHKFVGGISTPGVLMAKKKLFRHQVPEGCGGGTVFFVRRENHRYLQEPESKEEGGTPAIVQSIRAGLVVQLKQAVGVDTIHSRDQWLLSQAQTAWADCAELIQLGPRPGIGSPDKLPIFSFLVLHKQTGMFLHHNFVAAILNDVFGIQARGGCACAGPYAMDLLGLDEEKAKAIEELIAEDSRLDRTHLRRIGEYSHREILRPGFVRLNLPYFMDEACLQFVLEAVRMTAEHGWKLLPQYLFNPETAEWRQRHFQTFKDRKWLGHISYQSGQMKYHQPKQNVKGPLPTSYQDCLMKAKEIFDNAKKLRLKVPDQTALFDEAARPYRWFVLPSEASACLLHHQGSSSTPVPPRVAQDDLPFFPGRKIHREMRSNDQPDGLAEDSLQAGKVLYSEFKSPEQSVNADFQAVDLSKRTVDLGKNCDGTANNTGVTVSESAGESSRMLALENAVKYADTLLASSGLTVMTSEVSSVMNSIWERFDPKTDCKQEAEGPTATKSALDEVSSTLNQIWDSFTVKTTENSGTADNLVDPTSVRTASAALNDVADSADELPEASVLTETESWSAESQEGSVVTSALDEINAGLKQIWQGFIPQTPKPGEAMADTSLGTESHRGSTENSAWVNSDLHSSEMSYVEEVNVASASGEISSMMSSIWKQFTPEAGKNGPGTGAKPSETDVAEPRLGVSDVTGTSCNLSTEPRLGVSDVTNTCNSSSEPRLGESNVADSSAQNNLVSGNNENRMNPSLSNIKSDDFVKKDVGPEHDSKLSDTKGNSQSASFSQGGSDIIKSDDFVKEDVGPEHDSKLSETKGNSQLAREESLEIKVDAGQIKDNLPPEKTKTGLNGQLNTKSFVSAQEEIQNAINEIWEYFTPKQSRSIKEDTGVGQDLSNSKVGKAKDATVCDVTNGMNEIEKNFTNKNVNGNRALESTIIIDKTSHEATEFSGISESAKDKNKRAQQIVRELSELSKQGSNSLLERKADGNVALDSTGYGTNEAQEEVKNVMSQIWESFGVKNGRISSEELSRAEGVCEGVRSCVDATADIRDSQNGGGSSNVTTSDQGLINADQTHPAVLGIPPGWSNSGHCTRMSTQGSAREGSASFAEGMIQALTQGFGDLAVDYSGEGDQQEQGASFGILSEKICAPLQQTVTQDSKTDRDPVRSNTVKDGDLRKNITHGEICAGQEEWTLNTGPDLSKPLQKPVTEPDAAPVCSLIKQKGRQTETVKLKTSEVSAEPGGNSCETRTAVRWFAPPKQIFKPTVTALEEYGMLGDGDKVLVCLSGGKDSLSLLHTIRQYQFYAMGKGIKFEFGAVTVDPMTPAYDPSPLKQYLASLGVPYFYESQSILETAEQLPYECASICSFCSRMKRGRIYAAARREGYNVLALGQHLDDLAESFLMSFFHNGNLNTMKAHYTVKQGDLRVIRPFVYVREADLRAFAEQRKLPIIAENCPACFEAPKERHRTKQLLAAQEVMFPQVYSSMMAALRPLMARQITNKSSTVLEEEED